MISLRWSRGRDRGTRGPAGLAGMRPLFLCVCVCESMWVCGCVCVRAHVLWVGAQATEMRQIQSRLRVKEQGVEGTHSCKL